MCGGQECGHVGSTVEGQHRLGQPGDRLSSHPRDCAGRMSIMTLRSPDSPFWYRVRMVKSEKTETKGGLGDWRDPFLR